MTVREATTSDVLSLVAMGSRFIAESSYAGKIKNDVGAMTAAMEYLIGDENSTIFVLGDPLCGMIGLINFSHPMSGEKYVAEMFWWVEPEQRGGGKELLVHAENWAREHEAKYIQMIAPDERTESVYKRLGYTKVETHYQKEVAA